MLPTVVRQLQRSAGNRAAVQYLAAAVAGSKVDAAAAAVRPVAPAGSGVPVVQRKTELRFSNEVTGKSQITATAHSRGPVHAMAANWVFENGEWSSVPGGTVVNHSKGYEGAAQTILEDYVHEAKLATAAKNIMAIHKELRDHDKGVGAPTSTHSNRLDSIVSSPADEVDVDGVIDSFNYYMYKICDYPANLFVWPTRTGGDPDIPTGEYDDGEVMDWDARNPGKSKKKRLNDEKARLVDGRKELSKAIS
jgi:hypothetical protein